MYSCTSKRTCLKISCMSEALSASQYSWFLVRVLFAERYLQRTAVLSKSVGRGCKVRYALHLTYFYILQIYHWSCAKGAAYVHRCLFTYHYNMNILLSYKLKATFCTYKQEHHTIWRNRYSHMDMKKFDIFARQCATGITQNGLVHIWTASKMIDNLRRPLVLSKDDFIVYFWQLQGIATKLL